jgi:hypothetical protein
MTGSEKYTWGVILGVGGWLSLVGGIALSMTLFGACVGIPLAVIGLPVMVLGSIWVYQARCQKQQEVISAGIREGMASVQAVHLSILSPSPPATAVAPGGTPAETTPPLQIVEASAASEPIEEHPCLEVAEDGQQPDNESGGGARPS